MSDLISDSFNAMLPSSWSKRASRAQTSVLTSSSSPDNHDLEAGSGKKAQTKGETEVKKGKMPAIPAFMEEALERDNRHLRHQLREKEHECDAHQDRIAHLEKALRRKASESNIHKEEPSMAQGKVLSLKDKNNALTRELKLTRGKLDSSIMDLRKVQLSSFKQSQTGWFVEEDSKVRESLTQLYKDIRSWAKTHCVKTLAESDDMPEAALSAIINTVSRVAVINSTNDLLNFKYPFLILAALVSDLLSGCIFTNCFYMFYDPKDPTDRGEHIGALNDTFARLRSTSTTEAHTWRALLFKAMFPTPEGSELIVGRGFDDDRFKNILTCILDKIHSGPISVFFRTLNQEAADQCCQELRELIKRAIKLYSRLQAQRADYVWYSHSDHLCQNFDVHSPTTAADRLHKLEDDEDEACNGKQINLVISPAVRRFGDSNGENFDTGCVITKAVVFLEN